MRPARAGRSVPLPPVCRLICVTHSRLRASRPLHGHQRAAFDLLARGANVVVATGTASGKSLCYQLAALTEAAHDPQARALFLFPTKALAQDQARKIAGFKVAGVVPAIYDGDTPQDQRALLRRTATILLSNPDMLHIGILPGHERWAEFLHHLRYVVLDEAHVYRGVFGSHVAQVVRRLRRLCAAYGGSPSFVAHVGDHRQPARLRRAARRPALRDRRRRRGAAPERTVVLWNPPLLDAARGERRSALAEASYVIAEACARRRSRHRLRAHPQGGRARVRPRHAAPGRP